MELAIEKFPGGVYGYYFVDHDAQILFWPEPVRSRSLMNHVRGVTDKNHISERVVNFRKNPFFDILEPRVCAGGAILVRSPLHGESPRY